jgi:uncharacterized protein (UPF0212 family)
MSRLCHTAPIRGIVPDMGKYSCPSCDSDVAPVRAARPSIGESLERRADGLVVQRRRCPACGVRLERSVFEGWRAEGSRDRVEAARADTPLR